MRSHFGTDTGPIALVVLSSLLLLIVLGLLWRMRSFQKRAKSEIFEGEARFRSLFNTAPDGILTFDSEGIIESANRAGALIFGCESESMTGKELSAFLPGLFAGPDDERTEDKVDTGQSRVLGARKEIVGVRKDGSSVPIEVALSVLNFGNRLTYTVVVRDITQRIRAEERIKESDYRFRQMSNNINEIFWITDARAAVPVFVSPAYEQIYGRTVQSLFENPKQFFEATHPEDRDSLANVIRQQRTSDHSCEIEFRICRPDGGIRWIWARLSPMLDENGKLTGLCGISSDITEKKQAQVRVSEFYSMVSHELRTPLTSIRGSLKLIEGGRAGDLSSKTMQLIRIGVAESDRLMRLINDILDVKKVEGGQFELSKTPIESGSLISRALIAMTGPATEAGVNLKSNVLTERSLNGDFDRLLQVLTNLISNAIKFSKKGGVVEVTVEDGGRAIKFSVKDEGQGIPVDQMHKLFTKFQQLDSSDSRQKGGTGLGLAISKSIVELHSGQIGVDSKDGKGSTFWFEIPLEQIELKKQT